MATGAKQRFAPHEGVNRVELGVSGSDAPLVLDAGKVHETTDPAEISALDEHPLVKRVTEKASKADDGKDK